MYLGGGNREREEDYIEGLDDFLDEVMGKGVVDSQLNVLSDVSQMILRIKGGGHRDRTNSQVSQVSVNHQ